MSLVKSFFKSSSAQTSRHFIFPGLAAVFLSLAGDAEGAVRIWTGGAAPNGNWSAVANWDSGTPQNNDSIVFINGTANFLTTNNFIGRTISSITFSGTGGSMFLRGNAITLTGGISASHTGGADTCDLDITLETNNQTIALTGSGVGSALTLSGDMNLNGRNLTINVTDAGNVLVMSGAISGAGNITRNTGAGSLWFTGSAANTYSGTTTVNSGLIYATKFAGVISIPGDAVIGNGSATDTLKLNNNDQIATNADIFIHNGGVFDLDGNSNTVASVTFVDGGSVTTGSGRLQLSGSVTLNGVGVLASITGNLYLGIITRTFTVTDAGSTLTIGAVLSGGAFFAPAGIVKNGLGTLNLSAANTYGGLTSVNEGRLTVNNNLGLGGTFTLFGNAGTVVNSNAVLLLNNAHVTNEVLTLNSTNPNGALQDNSTADWIGSIVLNNDVVIEASSLFQLGGLISGPGGFTKVGGNTLRMIGTNMNTYAGTTFVNAGTLELDRSAFDGSIPGDLVIGDGTGSDVVRHLVQNQIANTSHVTVNVGGLLDLNGHLEGIGSLELTGGAVDSGASSLVLFSGGVTAHGSGTVATIDGTLNLGGAVRTFDIAQGVASPDVRINAVISNGGITKTGTGNLRLAGADTYAGLTTISNGFIQVANASALGSTNAGTILENGGDLLIEGVSVINESLVNNSAFAQIQSTGTAGWSGSIALNASIAIATFGGAGILDLSGAISGSGGVTKSQVGTLIYSGPGANTYLGRTVVNQGTLLLDKSVLNGAIVGPLFIGDGSGGVDADIVRLNSSTQIENNVPVTVNLSGLLDLNNNGEAVGSIAGAGNISLGSGFLNVGFDNISTTFSGVISGVGGSLTKFAGTTGTLTLSGNNTYSGVTTVNGGTVLVDGIQQQSSVNVGTTGTLGGTGVVGNLTASGTIAPGHSPGILGSSNVVFNASAHFNVEINGAIPGTGYDQLNVRGTNLLGGALNVTVGGGFAPAIGQRFTILSNDGVEPVAGTFAGLPSGSIVTAGIHKFIINYGNDVTLTYTNSALNPIAVQITGGNGNLVIDPNECNILNLVITNTAGIALNNIFATLSSTTPGVVITQPESAYPDAGINGLATNTTPFQISTLPSFNCGDAIDLNLTVITASGSFVTPFSLPSGSAGAPVNFLNGANLPIPDSGSVTSIINVVGFDTPITKVVVSLHITHTADEDLDISLISPDGTTINLSSDNGGTADDYGTDCVVGNRTVFSDDAATSITAGAAPFVGSFRPEQQLSAYIGKSGAQVNGAWKLVVADDSPGAVGTLRCWSLDLSPTACASGGGACDTCPGTFTGSITTNDLVRTDRIERLGTPSTCSVPKACSTFSLTGPYHYDTYTFTNTGGPACISVTLDTSCADALSAEAYLTSHNPADLCANYLADMGYSPSLRNGTFSFNVSAGATFVIVVTEVDNNSGCDYTLVVQGLDCPPVLAIDPLPADRVRLHWPTTAGGYNLEANSVLTTPNWTVVTNQPIVSGGQFNVTNSSVNPTNRFYRLNKL